MKAKRIGIAHSGNLESLGVVEKLFKTIVSSLEEEGREIRFDRQNTVMFEDGTIVSKFKAYGEGLGRKHTHLYIDQSVFNLENGDQLVMAHLVPTLMYGDSYSSSFDIEESFKRRVFTFDGELNIDLLYEDGEEDS